LAETYAAAKHHLPRAALCLLKTNPFDAECHIFQASHPANINRSRRWHHGAHRFAIAARPFTLLKFRFSDGAYQGIPDLPPVAFLP
jgi:hypothetical protein